MRIAVLGTGRMGAFRAEWLRHRAEVDDVLVGSRDSTRGLPVAEVLDAEPDAVVISSETPEHPAQVAACAARRLTMLCEKPVASTLRETREAIEAAERSGATLQVSFQRRFDPECAEARRTTASGALGTLYCVRINSYDYEPSPERFIPTSGGIFRDLHVHDFDQARWLTGLEVEEVYATGAVRKWERFARHGDADTAAALLTMEGELPVVVTGTRHNPRGYDFRAELLGSDGFAAVGPPPMDNPYRGFLDRFADAFDAEMVAFLELVRGERENPCPGAEALEALRVAVACDVSRTEGRPVRVEEVDDGEA